MYCEFCGRPLKEKSFTVLSGEKLFACTECGGKAEKNRAWKKTSPRPKKIVQRETEMDEGLDIAENFGTIIRQKRQQKGLTIEELALKLREKASVLQKIENNRLLPEDKVLGKLEKFFSCKMREKQH